MNVNALKRIQFSKLILPAIFLIVGLIFLIESNNINVFGFGDIILTALYPRILSVLMIICSLFVIVQNIIISMKNYTSQNKNRSESALMEDWKKAGNRLTMFMVSMIGYVLLIREVGYFETGFVFLALSMFFLGERSKAWFLKSTIIAAVITLVIYFIFGYLLNVYVPGGIIFRI